MHSLDWFLGTYENRDPAETGSGSTPVDERDSSHRSVTVSLTLALRETGAWKVIRARVPAPGLALPVSEARASERGRFRRLRHVLRQGLTAMAESPSPGSGQPPQPEPAAAAQPPEPQVSGSAGLSFWEELSLAEQEALRSVAVRQEFRVGDRLMREGDPADHVMVIIEGRTRVCVDENGWERVLAERGPGELIGERSGLQVRVRSASVIAQEAVRVLMVGTENFTAFVNAHPRVFDIVERQLYDRLTQPAAETQERDEPAVNPVPADSALAGTSRHQVPAAYEVMQSLWNGQNCTILFSDVVAFSSRNRNDGDRLAVRRALLDMTLFVLRGIPGAWSQDRGDGLLTVVPPSVPTADVITLLHKELPEALDRHNSAGRESTRFQLRVAVNVGPVTSDTIGVSGEAIIIAARLLDSPVFKNAIAQETAKLGIIASKFVYETVIWHCLNPIDLAGYSEVQAATKESFIPAWMKLFGGLGPFPHYFQPGVSDSPGNPLAVRLTGSGACGHVGAGRSCDGVR